MTYKLFYNDKEVDKLPEEFFKAASERLSKVMSAYYASHPKEYEKLYKSQPEKPLTS
jgi:hypothetical protein